MNLNDELVRKCFNQMAPQMRYHALGCGLVCDDVQGKSTGRKNDKAYSQLKIGKDSSRVPPVKGFLIICFLLSLATGLSAEDKATPKKLESFLLLPEPKAMRTKYSMSLGNALQTVLTPARQIAGTPGIEVYSSAEFAKLGISVDTFLEKARAAADKRLATMQPELIKDAAGRVRYAVYRGEEPLFACLLIAPSLSKIFEPLFGKAIWLVTPDRNSFYVFPANAPVLDDFAADLQERFDSTPYSASEEVFALKVETSELKAIGNFTNR
ncbi:hypothetical protein BH11VER1_BH11VER1_38630 [soil metagenome]